MDMIQQKLSMLTHLLETVIMNKKNQIKDVIADVVLGEGKEIKNKTFRQVKKEGKRMDKRIFLSSPHMSEEGYEQKYIKEAFDTNWIAPLGENVRTNLKKN